MKPKRNFKRDRVDAIIAAARVSMSVEQIAGVIFVDLMSARRYVRHMLESDALVIDHKVRKRCFYKSTGRYSPLPVDENYTNRDISIRREIKTNVKAFRDDWTALFFGPVNPV